MVSPDDRYVAISSVVFQHANLPPSNQGIVLDLTTNKDILKLDCGDYNTEHTVFPVAFFLHQHKPYLVHATDWNRLDITNLENMQLLTNRNLDDFSKLEEAYDDDDDDDDSFMTEWHGELKVSPNGESVATIGWVWHPLGVAFGFSLKKWIEGSQWEPENGESKKSYAIWDYFWHSPFLWLDNNRLCIWGAEGGQQSNNIPLNGVAIYNAEDGKILKYFSGPTMDVFYFDKYLFSAIHGQKTGFTIWSVEDGCLLHTEDSFNVMEYLPGSKEFVTYCDGGEILFCKWSECCS